MNKGLSAGAVVLGCLLLILWTLVVVPFLVMVGWNFIVGGVFHGPTLDFFHALGLSVLLSIISGVVRR